MLLPSYCVSDEVCFANFARYCIQLNSRQRGPPKRIPLPFLKLKITIFVKNIRKKLNLNMKDYCKFSKYPKDGG